MEYVAFSSIGFVVPACVALVFVLRTVLTMKVLDWALFGLAVAVQMFTAERGADNALHMVECYGFIALAYAVMQLHQGPGNARPISMVFTLCFLSMLIADIYGTNKYANGVVGTVGGAEWTDGLILWPVGISLGYLALSAISVSPRFNSGKQVLTWGEFFNLHFSPLPRKAALGPRAA